MVLGISIILVSEIKMIRGMGNSVVAFYAADSGIEKTFYYDRKVIPGGGNRGLCYICDSCSDCQDCTPSLPEGSSLSKDCGSQTCTNCTISYHTEFGEAGDEREYEVKATVVPFYGFSKTTIESFGDYEKTTRAIDLTFTSTMVLSFCSIDACTSACGDDWISRVQFNTIDKNSGQDGPYSDFTSESTTVLQGGSYDLTITISQGDSWEQCATVWIDFDQNGIFESNESTEVGCIYSDGGSMTKSILIPETAKSGSTRMRVIEIYNGYPTDPCGNYNYGEAEDYTIIIGFPSDPPTITSVLDSPDPQTAGLDVQFSIDWNDPDSSQIKIHTCKTDAITGQTCGGGSWCDSSSFTTDDPATCSHTTQLADVGTSPNNYYAFVCDDGGACSSSTSGTFTVENDPPTITSVSDTPDPQTAGLDVQFSVDWYDPDAGEQVKIHICKTGAITGQTCDGGSWCDSSSFTTDDPTTCSYTTQVTDAAVNDYYTFVCDDSNACSSSTSGTFILEGTILLRSLITTNEGGNGQNGNMFNITAKNPVIIRRFSTNWNTGSLTARIYWHEGGYVTHDDGNWQLVGTAPMTGVDGTFVEIPIDVDLTIEIGETYGFYITNSGGSIDIIYTDGTIETYSNDDLDLASSIGKEYPFGSTFSPRIWNGVIWYE